MEEVIRNGKPGSVKDATENNINKLLRGENRLVLPIVAGVALGAWGISRRNAAGRAIALAGGYLAYRASTRLRPYRVAVVVSQTINRPVEDVYRFCRDPGNWPAFMSHMQQAHGADSALSVLAERSRSKRLNLSTEVQGEHENELIAWQSSAGSEIRYRGTARFHPAPGNRGTEVTISLYYEAPAGILARSLATVLGRDPEQQARENLRALKALMEAGEIPTTVGQPGGKRGLKGKVLKTLYREKPSERAA